MGKPVPEIDVEAFETLKNYDWPGNVRELKNVTQRLVFYCDKIIKFGDLEQAITRKKISSKSESNFNFTDPDSILPLKDVEKKFRKAYFQFVRDHSESDADAASKIGLAPPNFHRMCKELGLK